MSTWTEPPHQRRLCPECESTQVYSKTGNPAKRAHPEPYRCDVCRAHFDDLKTAEKVCPECGSVDIATKSGGRGRPRTHSGNYHCGGCGTHFDDPAIECASTIGRRRKIPTAQLAADLARVAKKVDGRPTTTDYKEHGEFSVTPYYHRFDGDSWAEVVASALEQYPETP